MDYKTVLQKINIELSENNRAAARAFLLQEKKTGKAAAAVWSDIITRFGSDSDIKPVFDDLSDINPSRHKTTTKTGKARIKENKAVSDREIYSGDVVGGSFDTVQDSGGLDMSEIENKVLIALDDFISINDIQDMKKEPQRVWSACCQYIGRHCFKGTKILKSDKIYDNGSCMPSNCQKYDIDKIISVLSLYDFLCNKYNKAFTMDGGAAFCGLSDNYITEHREQLTTSGFDPRKKVENSVTSSLLDNGGGNKVGMIAFMNHHFNWGGSASSSPAPAVNVTVYPVLNTPATATALPDNSNM